MVNWFISNRSFQVYENLWLTLYFGLYKPEEDLLCLTINGLGSWPAVELLALGGLLPVAPSTGRFSLNSSLVSLTFICIVTIWFSSLRRGILTFCEINCISMLKLIKLLVCLLSWALKFEKKKLWKNLDQNPTRNSEGAFNNYVDQILLCFDLKIKSLWPQIVWSRTLENSKI